MRLKFSPLYIQPNSESDPFLDRIKLLVVYLMTSIGFVGGLFNLYFSIKNGDLIGIIIMSSFILLQITSVITFLIIHSVKIPQIIVSIGVFIIMTFSIVGGGGKYGLGMIYFISIFSIIFLLTTFNIGLAIPVYYFLGITVRVKFFELPQDSIFYNDTVINRFIILLAIACIIGIVANIFLRLFIRHITELAFTDKLSGIANRSKLREYILSSGKRASGFSLIGIKTSNLQKVSSNLGAISGDQYFKSVIKKVNSVVKSNEILGRWRGSVLLIISDCVDSQKLKERAVSILEQLKEPFEIERGKVSGQFITGISIFPRDTNSPIQLVENVNFLLDIKNVLPGDIIFFEKVRLEAELEKYRIIEAMNSADIESEFTLKYQPKIKLSDKSCIGAEVLLRWNNPVFGTISPDKFIPLAEESGFVKVLTRWIISKAFMDISNVYKKKLLDPTRSSFAINLSILDLKDTELVDYIKEQLVKFDLKPRNVEFEITEGLLIDEDPIIDLNLKELVDLGITIAVDDFGTGYSSLSYLHKLKIHNIKLDKSFIDLIESSINNPVLDAIISMGKSLGLQITAEGIENEEQELYLKDKDCDVAQGWLYSRAVYIDEYEKFISTSS